MKINVANSEKIEAALSEVQARATVRTISAEDVLRMCEEVEDRLGIPKYRMKGVKFTADYHAQKFPNAYKYTPMSTIVTCEYSGKNWNLIEVYRGSCFSPTVKYGVSLTDEARKAIIQRCEVFY